MQTKLESEKKKNEFYKNYGKRLLDLIISIPILIILLPLFGIIGITIKMDSTGPIIYKQKRVGKDKKDFYVYKFRTMVMNADKVGPASTKYGDDRITKFGSVLRRTSIDELPQLINVLIGDMSLIGYRPGVRDEDFENKYGALFELKPGITGYAQVNGRSNLTPEEKRYWELKYLDDINFITDSKIIMNTLKVVFTGKGSN